MLERWTMPPGEIAMIGDSLVPRRGRRGAPRHECRPLHRDRESRRPRAQGGDPAAMDGILPTLSFARFWVRISPDGARSGPGLLTARRRR